MTEVFMEKEDFEKKTETGGQVMQSSKQAAPPRSVWASVPAFASPSTHTFMYPKNLISQRDGIFCDPERHHHHDLHL
jgi:hypothetical protein